MSALTDRLLGEIHKHRRANNGGFPKVFVVTEPERMELLRDAMQYTNTNSEEFYKNDVLRFATVRVTTEDRESRRPNGHDMFIVLAPGACHAYCKTHDWSGTLTNKIGSAITHAERHCEKQWQRDDVWLKLI